MDESPAIDRQSESDQSKEILDRLCINTIRTLSIDAIQKADSGHPGMPMGAATMAYVLWTRHLRHNPKNPEWPDRDRFVLSAGHASTLLYSVLFLTGYDLAIKDIEHFRQWESRTPGHPENGRSEKYRFRVFYANASQNWSGAATRKALRTQNGARTSRLQTAGTGASLIQDSKWESRIKANRGRRPGLLLPNFERSENDAAYADL